MAIHTVTGHRVAMKCLPKHRIKEQNIKIRVQKEIEFMRVLRHPHIIKLSVHFYNISLSSLTSNSINRYEVINTPQDIIIVLEYAGGELFNYIINNGTPNGLPTSRTRLFFQQLISGIEYTHRLGIVHRDLKPENILLDNELNIKIADYGLSNRIVEGEFLDTSCGSANYAAPEIVDGRVYAGPGVDVWSAGVIFYVMLFGRLPFEHENNTVLFRKIISECSSSLLFPSSVSLYVY